MNLWGMFFMFIFVPINIFISNIMVNYLEWKILQEEKKKNGGEMQYERMMQYN